MVKKKKHTLDLIQSLESQWKHAVYHATYSKTFCCKDLFHNLGFVAHQLIGPTYKNSIAQRGKHHKIKNQMEYYKQT